MLLAVGIIAVLFDLLIVYSCCCAAARADQYLEDHYGIRRS